MKISLFVYRLTDGVVFYFLARFILCPSYGESFWKIFLLVHGIGLVELLFFCTF
jgi:hypothetical protein